MNQCRDAKAARKANKLRQKTKRIQQAHAQNDGAEPQSDAGNVASSGSRRCRCEWLSAKTLAKTFCVLIWLGSGLLVLCIAEELHFISALYVLVQAITTIGYGDIPVQSSDGVKAFWSVYSLFCCVVVGGLVISACNSAIQTSHIGLGNHLGKLLDDHEAEGGASSGENAKAAESKSKKPWLSRFWRSFIAFMALLCVGTVFFAVFEKCTCSYSESKVDGCDPDNCEDTGGYTKSVLDAWYMSCISLTTIGFGDVSPKSLGGRFFASIWMIVGVAAVGDFACQFSKSYLEAERLTKLHKTDVYTIFDKIDTSGNGVLDRFEFLCFAVMEYGLIDESDLDAINKHFDTLDKDKSGELTRDELCEKFTKARKNNAKRVAEQNFVRQMSAALEQVVGPDFLSSSSSNNLDAMDGDTATPDLSLSPATRFVEVQQVQVSPKRANDPGDGVGEALSEARIGERCFPGELLPSPLGERQSAGGQQPAVAGSQQPAVAGSQQPVAPSGARQRNPDQEVIIEDVEDVEDVIADAEDVLCEGRTSVFYAYCS